ncbi:MAG TPA: DUF2971 domain-containing protein [Armatimonadota bacterium]|nr:DUF2971 domain-containing protein [Armatimonadota bacterium]
MARTRGAISPSRAAIRRVLDTFRQNIPELVRGFVTAADSTFDWRLDGSVYQYTRFETLRSMLGGPIVDPTSVRPVISELWATSSIHLNDAREFRRGQEVVEHQLARLPNDDIRRRMRLAIKDADALEVYCSCFSAVDDDLSQWRGYGDDGAGVCLRFDLGGLLASVNGIGYWVVYGKPGNETVQMSVADQLLDYVHSTIRLNLPLHSVPGAVYNEVRQQLSEIWPALFLAFKHDDFRAENEFRIVYSDAVGRPIAPCFRPDPIIPFVKLQMRHGARLPIQGIRLGPAASADANVRSLELALARLGLGHIRVDKSDIPYVPR